MRAAIALSVLLAFSSVGCISIRTSFDEATKKECRDREKMTGSSGARAFLKCQDLVLRGWVVFVW